MRCPLLAAAAMTIFVAISPAFASHAGGTCSWSWCSSTGLRLHYASPICYTYKEPIGLRHGYMIYLPHQVCRRPLLRD
jgi:hypothetical protein